MSENEMNQSVKNFEEVRHDPTSSRYDLFECPDCDNIVLALGCDDPPVSCHDKPMERISDSEMSVKPPDLKQVLLSAFGLPKAGLDLLRCVIEGGPHSANEVAESLGYDRSTVTRYLNKLVDLDLLQRSELNREDGGVVNVYHSVDLEQMRRETLIGFYVWAGQAAELIIDVNLAKQDGPEENSDQEVPGVFWESFRDE